MAASFHGVTCGETPYPKYAYFDTPSRRTAVSRFRELCTSKAISVAEFLIKRKRSCVPKVATVADLGNLDKRVNSQASESLAFSKLGLSGPRGLGYTSDSQASDKQDCDKV